MVKKFRPITPGQRQKVIPTFDQLTRPVEGSRRVVKPTKALMAPKRRCNGRNNHGHITCRHRGGGAKRHLRLIDFKRDKIDIPARVASIEYDPNRSAFIALLNYVDGERRYIIAPAGIKAGDTVMTATKPPYRTGNCMELKDMPVGSVVHCIEMVPGRGAAMCRSAGMSAEYVGLSGDYAVLKLPSGEMRKVPQTCRATLGVVSNQEHLHRVLGKAGAKRHLGIRPTVRGTAMNPIDHPHGGGEGKHNGYIPQSPWALQTKGKKTRVKSKSTKMIIKDRRK